MVIIKSGSVKVSLPYGQGSEFLVDLRGAVSLLQGCQALFDVTACEGLITFLLPTVIF
jgi:hypothetical protein